VFEMRPRKFTPCPQGRATAAQASLGMFAFGSVGEHDPERHPDACSRTQTKDSNAGDGGRASYQ